MVRAVLRSKAIFLIWDIFNLALARIKFRLQQDNSCCTIVQLNYPCDEEIQMTQESSLRHLLRTRTNRARYRTQSLLSNPARDRHGQHETQQFGGVTRDQGRGWLGRGLYRVLFDSPECGRNALRVPEHSGMTKTLHNSRSPAMQFTHMGRLPESNSGMAAFIRTIGVRVKFRWHPWRDRGIYLPRPGCTRPWIWTISVQIQTLASRCRDTCRRQAGFDIIYVYAGHDFCHSSFCHH